MLRSFLKADNDDTGRSEPHSPDDLDAIIEHYKRTNAAEKRFARALAEAEAETQQQPQGAFHGPRSPTD